MTPWRPGTAAPPAITEARRALNASTSERAFQASVVDLAELRHWRVWHDQDSRRNAAGMPDLILLRPPRLLFVELKTDRGRLRPEQREWLDELGRCPGVEVHVWRPGDWPTIEEVLR